ncbi:hypothetical protein ACJJIL_18375 [Microbulbifer sp. EKSA005]
MKFMKPLAAAVLAVIHCGALADSNVSSVSQQGSMNAATIDQSDPSVTDNQIVVIQDGTGNVSDAEQVNNTTNSVITHIQIGDNNEASSI